MKVLLVVLWVGIPFTFAFLWLLSRLDGWKLAFVIVGASYAGVALLYAWAYLGCFVLGVEC